MLKLKVTHRVIQYTHLTAVILFFNNATFFLGGVFVVEPFDLSSLLLYDVAWAVSGIDCPNLVRSPWYGLQRTQKHAASGTGCH